MTDEIEKLAPSEKKKKEFDRIFDEKINEQKSEAVEAISRIFQIGTGEHPDDWEDLSIVEDDLIESSLCSNDLLIIDLPGVKNARRIILPDGNSGVFFNCPIHYQPSCDWDCVIVNCPGDYSLICRR